MVNKTKAPEDKKEATKVNKKAKSLTEIPSQMKLDLPDKVSKKQKGFYIEETIIDFIKNESIRLGVSENVLLVSIVKFYQLHGC